MKLRLIIGEQTVFAPLAEGATSRDFASLLPLALNLADYAASEKISDLPRRLNIQGAPDGMTPVAGDIAYYAPWGNLAIFYGDAPHATGLIPLARLDTGCEPFRGAMPLAVTIELATSD